MTNGAPDHSEAFENKDGKIRPISTGSATTVATMSDFLSKLSMKVWNGTELIYEASPDELDGLRTISYWHLPHRRNATLKVELAVPADLGNEYANRVGEVD